MSQRAVDYLLLFSVAVFVLSVIALAAFLADRLT